MKRALTLWALLILMALSVHTYGVTTPALNSGAYVDLGGPYCVGLEFHGNPGPFWFLPDAAGGGSPESCE